MESQKKSEYSLLISIAINPKDTQFVLKALENLVVPEVELIDIRGPSEPIVYCRHCKDMTPSREFHRTSPHSLISSTFYSDSDEKAKDITRKVEEHCKRLILPPHEAYFSTNIYPILPPICKLEEGVGVPVSNNKITRNVPDYVR